MNSWLRVRQKKAQIVSTAHVSVPSSDQTRSQGAVLGVSNQRSCIRTTKHFSNGWFMLVGCIHTVDNCCNACCHFELAIGQDQNRRHTAVTLSADGTLQQLHTTGMADICKPLAQSADWVTQGYLPVGVPVCPGRSTRSTAGPVLLPL